jgi:hypothetical protein
MTKANNNVRDLFDGFQEETCKLIDFPMSSDATTWTIDEFLDVPTFPINRNVEIRARKQAPLLTKTMHKHSEVDILHYTGKTTNEPAYFKQGSYYVLDGNTRQYCWRRHYTEGQVVDKGTTVIPVPKKVNVRIYTMDSAKDACDLYYTIDSQQAVETKGDILTGAFRSQNLLNTFNNKKLVTGKMAGAMMIAAPFGPKQHFQVPDVDNIFDQTRVLKDGLVEMDKANAFVGHFHVQPTIGMALLAGVIMEHNERWIAAIERLARINVNNTEDLGFDDFEHQALYYLAKGNGENPIKEKDALPYKTGIGQKPYVVKNYLAYMWMKFINEDENISLDYKDKEMRNAYGDMLDIAWRTQ